jgi:hypothetical protein
MTVYYFGPVPKTDEERVTMRVEPLSALSNMKDNWEQTAKTSQHGLNVLPPASAVDRYNEKWFSP